MVNLSEKETREKYIDPILEEVGWKEEYIKRMFMRRKITGIQINT